MLLQRPKLKAGTVGLYLPASATKADLHMAAEATPFLILTGGAGKLAWDLRSSHPDLPFLVDPGGYQVKARRPGMTPGEQLGVGASRSITAGVLIEDLEDVRRHMDTVILRRQSATASSDPDGLVSISVTGHVLRDAVEAVSDVMSAAGGTYLTLTGSNDPLELAGTVPALLELLRRHPSTMLARCDLGALGAVAHGAPWSTIGLTATYRHNPSGGGGTRNDDSPSLFVRTLMGFKKPTLLDQWRALDPDVEHDITCEWGCCEGASLTRFVDPARWGEAMRHNAESLMGVATEVLACPPGRRAAKFTSLMRNAEFQSERLRARGLAVSVPRQIKQWSAATA